MLTKRVTILLLLTILAALAVTGCGRGADRAGNAQGGQLGIALTEQPANQVLSTAQPTSQPTTLPEETQPPAQANTPMPAPAEPTTQPEQPAATEIAIPPLGDTAEALRGAWSQAYELPPGVPFAVTFTEAQVEAMIAEAMAKSGQGSNISSINVTLNNGQIGVGFTLTMSQKVGPKTVNASGTATVIFGAAIDSNGKLALTVASASVAMASGPQRNIPPELLSALNAALGEAMTGASGNAEVEATLTEILITGGTMTVKGYVTP